MLKMQKSDQVDRNRIGLWGTSLGGGHVTVVAAQDPSIRAVVALVPAMASGLESMLGQFGRDPSTTLVGVGKFVAALLRAGVLQLSARARGGVAWYMPLTSEPGGAGLMQNPGDHAGYTSLTPPGRKNMATVGSGVRLLTYRPINFAAQVQSPTLMISAQDDKLCPAEHVAKATRLIGAAAELLELPGAGHFDVYSGELLQRVLEATVDFFRKELV